MIICPLIFQQKTDFHQTGRAAIQSLSKKKFGVYSQNLKGKNANQVKAKF